jgi:hypothetical protein
MQKLTQQLKIAFRHLFPIIEDNRGTVTPEQAMAYVNERPVYEGDTPFVAVSCEPLRERFRGTVSICWSVKAMYEGELIEWAVWAVPSGIYGEW